MSRSLSTASVTAELTISCASFIATPTNTGLLYIFEAEMVNDWDM
jgi:hypothetical protein